MAAKPFSVKFSDFPFAAAKILADMLTGKVAFDKWKAIYAAMEVSAYLMKYAADTYSAKAIRASKVSKKVVGQALEKLVEGKRRPSAATFDIPVWLLPILVKMILKWIENNYPKTESK
jgi:hypothetical protein